MSKQIKRRQFWTAVHRYCGLAILLFLGLAALTGIILSFDKPLDAALNADLFRSPAGASIRPLQAVRAFEVTHPDVQVLSFPLRTRSGDTLMTTVAPRPGTRALLFDEVFLDSSSGHVAGVRQSRPGWDRRHLMLGVYDFHYTLLAGTAGRWLMGIVALGWLIGNLVGFYLTFPLKSAFWRQWKKSWTVRAWRPTMRLFFDLHRASGLWVLIGVTILAFTSVSMNFFDELFVPAMTQISPSKPSPFDEPPREHQGGPRVSPTQAAEIASSAVTHRDDGWMPAKVAYDPEYALYRVLLTDNGFENYHRLGPVSLYVDASTGAIAYEDDPYKDSAGRKLTRALYPLHTGQVAGGIGVAVVVVLGLTTLETCITGGYLWWKRRRPRVAARRARRLRARNTA